jgi:hypothetical protein
MGGERVRLFNLLNFNEKPYMLGKVGMHKKCYARAAIYTSM